MGELGLCGVAATIAVAVQNATGVRVRDSPIMLDGLAVGVSGTARADLTGGSGAATHPWSGSVLLDVFGSGNRTRLGDVFLDPRHVAAAGLEAWLESGGP